MSQRSVLQFAKDIEMPVSALLELCARPGIRKSGPDEPITEQDKRGLLDFLRRRHGEGRLKIISSRKQSTNNTKKAIKEQPVT